MSAAVVHTTGINWEGLLATAGSVTVLVSAALRYFSNKITDSVDRLGSSLKLELETKKRVNEVAAEVTELKQWKKDVERKRHGFF